MASMTTIRVDPAVRDRLAALAAAHNRTLGEELSAIVDEMAWQLIAEGYSYLAATTSGLADYRAQAEEWANEGLEELAAGAEEEYPEYNPRS